MKIKTILLGFTIAGVTALSASCSGSTDSNESSGGKSSSSTAGKSASTAGASTNGGASSNGGTKSGTAGTVNSGGQNGNAGTTSNGGNVTFGGGFNLGGAGFDPADFMCKPVPTKGSACAAGTQPCVNGTAICFCQAMKWACRDVGGAGGAAGAGPGGGFGQLDCPATKPMNGGDCGDTLGFCPFGQGGCACYNGMWACN